jgi:transcription elongation factor Elf1
VKAVCPSCERLIDVTAVKVVGESAFIGCAKCGVESALPITTGELPTLPETPKAAPPLPLSSRKTPGPRALVLASSAEASNVVMLRAPTAAAVDSARAFADADPFMAPDGFCPKCVSRREGATACPTCGLVYANVEVDQLRPPEDLAAMWKELLREWGDESRHAAVRRLAMERSQLPELARLYRLRLAAMPEDPIAQRGRDDVLAAATSVVLLPRGQPQPAQAPVAVKVFVGGIALTLIAVAVVMMMRMLS